MIVDRSASLIDSLNLSSVVTGTFAGGKLLLGGFQSRLPPRWPGCATDSVSVSMSDSGRKGGGGGAFLVFFEN